MSPSVLDRFRQIVTNDLPDVHALADMRLKLFWVLAIAKKDSVIEFLTAAQLADILRDCVGVNLPRQRITATLEKDRQAVSRTKRKGTRYFKLMRVGEEELGSSVIAPLFIDPAKAFSAVRQVEVILGGLSGDLEFCDTYVDRRTLDFLASCTKATSIKLLTENVQGDKTFRADLAAFNCQHNDMIEVRVMPQGHLHDRYIAHSQGMLLIGGSLKDLGKKQSMVVTLGEDVAKAVSTAFRKNWSNASKF
jgi:hypothetical protein